MRMLRLDKAKSAVPRTGDKHFQQEQTSFVSRKADRVLVAKGMTKLFKLFFYHRLIN